MNKPMAGLLNSNDIIDRVFEHIDNGTTDLGETVWKEPVDHYDSRYGLTKRSRCCDDDPWFFAHPL